METNERGFRWEKELLLRAFFSSMIHAVRVYMVEENEKKSNVCKIFLTFPLPICELIEIKGMERSHHGARFFPDWSVCSGYSRIIINIR